MTTHQMANRLLELPNIQLVIEGWCVMKNHEISADLTEYDPEGEAIIWQKPLSSTHENHRRAPAR